MQENAQGKATIIYYSIVKSKGLSRGVLAPELFVAFHALDFARTIKTKLDDIFKKASHSYCIQIRRVSTTYLLVGINDMMGKHLLMSMPKLCKSYELGKLANVIWIPSAQTPTRAMTMDDASPSLRNLIEQNRLHLKDKPLVELLNFVLSKWANPSSA